jgi:hypothetical protein
VVACGFIDGWDMLVDETSHRVETLAALGTGHPGAIGL